MHTHWEGGGRKRRRKRKREREEEEEGGGGGGGGGGETWKGGRTCTKKTTKSVKRNLCYNCGPCNKPWTNTEGGWTESTA